MRTTKRDAPFKIDGIPEEEETECADDLWAYIEAHKEEVEDLEEWAKKRGIRS